MPWQRKRLSTGALIDEGPLPEALAGWGTSPEGVQALKSIATSGIPAVTIEQLGLTDIGFFWVGSPDEEPPPEMPITQISVYGFKQLLTPTERKAIRASTNEDVIDFLDLLNSLTCYGEKAITFSDPQLIRAVNALELLGLLKSGRAAQILANLAPPADTE